MKKLFLMGLLASLLVFTTTQAQAFDRVTSISKTCKYTVTTAANAGADAVLTQANGNAYCDVSNIVIDRIVLEENITNIAGTNVIFKVITTSDPANSGATTDIPLIGSDGSTPFVSATLTATGRASRGTTLPLVGGSGLTSNAGTKLGVWADVTSLTALDGTVWLTIFGKQ